jgi:two-component system, chemotaxis family, protein-glutamate methylesterase/glutaminase
VSGFELVVVGGSWGGLDALGTLLDALPRDFGPPIAAVLHRRADGGEALPRIIGERGRRQVREVHDKDPIEPGRVYLAPSDYHALVEPGRFALSTEGKVRYSRPSIDVLFESAADSYRERLLGVLLTGTGTDGAAGMGSIKRRGGLTVAEDPRTAERGEMPAAAIAAGAADRTLGLDEIAPFVASVCGSAA